MKSFGRLLSVVLFALLPGLSCELPLIAGSADGARGVEIVEAQLGTRLRADKTIPTRRLSVEYRPDHTVYLALRLYGSGTRTSLGVRWYYGNRLVEQERRVVAPDGLSRTAFDFHPPEGMNPGPHQVVVLLDGKEVERLHFAVNAPRS